MRHDIEGEQPRLLTTGERHQQIRQLNVGAMRGDEPLDIVALAPPACVAREAERLRANVG